MNILRTQLVSWTILGCLFAWGSNFLVGQEYKRGALILVSKSGDVSFETPAGEKAPVVVVGNPIPPSYTIITGSDGELLGLLSNGTLLTVTEGTRMKVKTFKQEPFIDGGEKLRDLPGEPSRSKVEIDLEIGSLVVKTKKLNKGSVFDINSPVGVAGIRGTEFQMASMPGKGVQLDVTESTVAFTPPGGGMAVSVNQGSGLTVSPSGVPQIRPVSPIAAQKIEKSNEAATEATQNVSLGEVSAAIEQVESELDSGGEEQVTEEAEEITEDTEESAEESTEEGPSENTQEEEPKEGGESIEEVDSVEESDGSDDTEASTQSNEPVEEQTSSDEGAMEQESNDLSSQPAEEVSFAEEDTVMVEAPEEAPVTTSEEQVVQTTQEAPVIQEQSDSTAGNSVSPMQEQSAPAKETSSPSVSASPQVADKAPNLEAKASSQTKVPQQDKAQLLENNPEFKMRQETAIFDLDDAQVERYGQLSKEVQDFIKTDQEDVVKRLLSESGFGSVRVEDFYGYTEGTRNLLLELEDERMFSMLDGQYEESVLNHGLSIGLTETQISNYAQLGNDVQNFVKVDQEEVVRRLFSESKFDDSRLVNFYEYSEDTRVLILSLDDELMFTLLDEKFDEELLVESLTKMNIDFSNPLNTPKNQPSNPQSVRLQELSQRLEESGNGWVMEELMDMSGGKLTEEWIRIGEVADVLLKNHLVDDLNPADVFQTSEVRINPFYTEVSALYDELKLDALVMGAGVMIGANDLIIPENSQALNPYFGDGVDEVVLSASQSISFEGDVNWEVPVGTNEARLVVMSGGALNLKEGMTLESATSDLILSTREDLLLRQVNLNAAGEVVIRGLRDVNLEDVSIRASNLAKIKARRNLDVNGLSFRQDISKIVMEATTLRLRNVDFPGAAQVRLNSLKGGFDGRYPNFGNVSTAQQIGRVNFIENVKSGGNLINNRASFDQHGKNIQIGKIANP